MHKKYNIFVITFAIMLALFPATSFSDNLGSDPRIRTIIYGENDVFNVNSVFGYQTVVQFQEEEKILTISVGNPNIFRLTPSKNMLFVKAFQNGQQTNMTLVTTKRMYQFDLTSNPDNMMYLVKFIYPDEIDSAKTGVANSAPMSLYTPIHAPAGMINPSADIMTNIPSASGMMMGNMPDMNMPIDTDVPLSIRLKSAGEPRGLNNLSPIEIEAPALKSPWGFNFFIKKPSEA